MMLDKHIQAIIELRSDKSPIFYGSIIFMFKINRKLYPFKAEKIVMKGTLSQISDDPETKRKIILHYYGDTKAGKLKAKTVDLDKIIIEKIIVFKFLGYGIKC
jgi:hypothetical protein